MTEPSLRARFEAHAAGRSLRFDDRGLLPVVVQDAFSGAVLMVAWANQEAIDQTLETGRAHFFSRSRQSLWRKGETSGNELEVLSVQADCDADTLLVRARPHGPTCHRETRTCFDAEDDTSSAAQLELGWLAQVIAERAHEAEPGSSYTALLMSKGTGRIAQKVGEEAVETVIAALDGERRELVEESADLLYHLLVLLHDRGVEPLEIARELEQRHAQRATFDDTDDDTEEKP